MSFILHNLIECCFLNAQTSWWIGLEWIQKKLFLMKTTGNTDFNVKISSFCPLKFVFSSSEHKSLGNNLSGYPVEVTFNVKNVETFQYTRENDLRPEKLQLGFTVLPWPWVLNHNELVELYHFVSERWISPLIYNGLYNMTCWHLLMIQIISHNENLVIFYETL